MEISGVKIEWLGHSGFVISCGNGRDRRIVIDPYNISEKVAESKADVILITHSHYDHCSIKDIERLSKPGTVIVVPADAQSKITKIENVRMEVIETGEEIEIGKLRVEALPAYNLDKEFHTKKDNFLGYLIKTKNVILYHSGDSDKIPEMEKLTGYGKHENNFIVFLPVSGKYVMNADEAASVAIMLNADIAIPMHYGSGVAGTIEDAKRFVEICKKEGVSAEILDKI